MNTVYFILLLLGALCFARGAIGFASDERRGGTNRRNHSLVALGLFFWIAVPLIQTGRLVF